MVGRCLSIAPSLSLSLFAFLSWPPTIRAASVVRAESKEATIDGHGVVMSTKNLVCPTDCSGCAWFKSSTSDGNYDFNNCESNSQSCGWSGQGEGSWWKSKDCAINAQSTGSTGSTGSTQVQKVPEATCNLDPQLTCPSSCDGCAWFSCSAQEGNYVFDNCASSPANCESWTGQNGGKWWSSKTCTTPTCVCPTNGAHMKYVVGKSHGMSVKSWHCTDNHDDYQAKKGEWAGGISDDCAHGTWSR